MPDPVLSLEEMLKLRERLQQQIADVVGQAVATGFVPTVTLDSGPTPVMGQYAVVVEVRLGSHYWRHFYNELQQKGLSIS